MQNNHKKSTEIFRSTTILCVRTKGLTVMGGDGQVSFGETILKNNALKVRSLREREIIVGFAGASADAFTLFELFEKKVEKSQGNLEEASVDLAREWRTDRMLRRLEALLLVADSKEIFLISGTGDVIAPSNDAIAIGSGSNYALAAARALIEATKLDALEIVKRSLKIAAEICVYTNSNLVIEKIPK